MRNRRLYAGILTLVIVIGLPNRLLPEIMPPVMVQYGGDALWALAIFLVLGLLFPAASTRNLFVLALVLAWGIEFSQLYQAAWINALRQTRIGGIMLGYTFLWVDLLLYLIGTGAGALLEKTLLLRKTRHASQDDTPGSDGSQKPLFPPD